MADENKKGVGNTPLVFPKTKKVAKEWTVKESFYDLEQKRVVNIGEIVSHNEKREKLNLIEQ